MEKMALQRETRRLNTLLGLEFSSVPKINMPVVPWIRIVALLSIPLTFGRTWTSQTIETSSQYSGVALVDVNNDGATDLVFSSGYFANASRGFVLVNTGKDMDSNEFSFSDPVALPQEFGGSYRSVDVTSLTSSTSMGILLAGSTSNQPAILLEIRVSSCGYWPPDSRTCQMKTTKIWTSPSTARYGVFSRGLGGNNFPALVVSDSNGVSIYEPTNNGNGGYSTTASKNFTTQPFEDATALAADSVGPNHGIVVGSSSGELSKSYLTVRIKML